MRAASVLLLAGICALSATTPHTTFRYEVLTSFRRQNNDTCKICYGDDCTTMDEARCEYYVEVDEVLDKLEEDGEMTEVDEMMYGLTEQASMSWEVQTCIPLISYYSNCNKENVCVGCKTCTCTMTGRWDCKTVQKCRAEVELDVDHRTLVMVIEKLMETDNRNRRKRSVKYITHNESNDLIDKSEVNKMKMVDIAEWMYGVRPNITADLTSPNNNTNFTEVLVNDTEYSTESATGSSKTTEPENLDFEEVLKNIATEDHTYKRRKSQLKDKETFDYMDIDDIKIIKSNDSDQFMHVLNAIEEGNDEDVISVTDAVDNATFVIDLYPRDNYSHNDRLPDNMNVNNIYKEDNNTIDFSLNDRIEFDAVNIMKRDTSSVTNETNAMDTTSTSTTSALETFTDINNDFKNNVLIPLTNIIDDKQKEVRELVAIKENLMLLRFNNKNVNITKDPEAVNSSNTYFSIYKLDLIADFQDSLRTIGHNVLDKVLYKLKRDIYEVLRDIARIQKLSNTQDLPDDLKMLIRSMKYYMHKQGSVRNFKNKDIKLESPKTITSRRLLLHSIDSTRSSKTGICVRNQIIDILEVLDKGVPQMNALKLLSKSNKKIMKRVIKQHYVDDFSAIGLKIYDTGYNLSNDLKRIGKAWQQLTANLENSLPHEKLYAMKLLHFTLSGDIERIIDAIALVNFAHSRRMTPIETPMAEDLMDKINDGLDLIKSKVKFLIKYRKERERKDVPANTKNTNKKKIKESFLRKLKNILRHSKKDIVGMAKNKVPKSEIVKTIAKNKFGELAKKNMYEQAMLRWQRNLNIVRRKRNDLEAQLKRMKNRIKNIIPKYLRGKINPAIAKKRKSRKRLADNEKIYNRKNFTTRRTKAKTSSTKLNNTKSTTHSALKQKQTSKQKTLTTPKTIYHTDEAEYYK